MGAARESTIDRALMRNSAASMYLGGQMNEHRVHSAVDPGRRLRQRRLFQGAYTLIERVGLSRKPRQHRQVEGKRQGGVNDAQFPTSPAGTSSSGTSVRVATTTCHGRPGHGLGRYQGTRERRRRLGYHACAGHLRRRLPRRGGRRSSSPTTSRTTRDGWKKYIDEASAVDLLHRARS